MSKVSDNGKKLKTLAIMAECYNKEFSEEALFCMTRALKNVDGDELSNAIDSLLAKNKFMPSVVELLEEVENIKQAARVVLEQKVMNWLDKNTDWDYSKQLTQSYIDEALVELGLETGTLDEMETNA